MIRNGMVSEQSLPQKGMRCEWGRAPIQSETTAALRPTTVLILIDPDDFERYQL